MKNPLVIILPIGIYAGDNINSHMVGTNADCVNICNVFGDIYKYSIIFKNKDRKLEYILKNNKNNYNFNEIKLTLDWSYI